jgi:hypothetical protein
VIEILECWLPLIESDLGAWISTCGWADDDWGFREIAGPMVPVPIITQVFA